jgi:hypothetical protein
VKRIKRVIVKEKKLAVLKSGLLNWQTSIVDRTENRELGRPSKKIPQFQ